MTETEKGDGDRSGGSAGKPPLEVESSRRGTEAWLESGAGRWWVLHRRARNEKRIAEMLDERRVEYYPPLVRVQRCYAKSRFTFELPLFPGYVFLRGDHDVCETAWRTNRVANILTVDNQDQLRTELKHIYRVLTSGQAVELYPAMQEGQFCRIISGPLKGVEGVVIRRGQRYRMSWPCRRWGSRPWSKWTRPCWKR